MNNDFSILVVDDDIHALENFRLGLIEMPYQITLANGYDSAVNLLHENHYYLLITDLKMPLKNGLDLAEFAINQKYVEDVILVTGFGDEDTIEKAIKLGISDFIRKPYDEKEFKKSIEKIFSRYKLKKENEELKALLMAENKLLKNQILSYMEEDYQIISNDKNIKSILEKAKVIANFSASCLISGESGTGKELLARYIHKNGTRSNQPFIAVNCASLSPSLFESELFGYVKGAFTGANNNTPGLFEIADHGILFLDEISEIPFNLQAKLLRVIETGKVRRVGDNRWKNIDVQVLVSTNRHIEELTNGKILRNDLFYRVTSSILYLPPLRERNSDIPELVKYFIKKYSKFYSKSVPFPDDNVIKKLINFNWPGNIRQLSNFVKNYVIFNEIATEDEMNKWMGNDKISDENDLTFKFLNGTMQELEEAKHWLVTKILKKYNYNQSKTAKHLGMSYAGLHRMLQKIRGLYENDSGESTDK
jgi:two-component system response regulator HydG